MFVKSGEISNVKFDRELNIIVVKLTNHMVFVTTKAAPRILAITPYFIEKNHVAHPIF